MIVNYFLALSTFCVRFVSFVFFVSLTSSRESPCVAPKTKNGKLLVLRGVQKIRDRTDFLSDLSLKSFQFLMANQIALPHSGQNFGIFSPALSCQPQEAQPVLVTAIGLPHSAQNLPLFSLLPHSQSQPVDSAGFDFPHSAQNFPALAI